MITRSLTLLILICSMLDLPTATAQPALKVMMIFAHPDEGEVYTGGITALYTQMGHQVKYVSLTNGDAGHFSMEPAALAKRRYGEAMEAKEILQLADYEVWNYHDGKLANSATIQQEVAEVIKTWNPDIVFTFYPAQGGHNDNMTAGYIVRDAAELLDHKPVFMYIRDFHTANFSYLPDIAIPIDEVWEVKLQGLGAHRSQVLEYNPYHMGTYDEVQASKELQEEYLYKNAYDWSHVTPGISMALEYWWGKEAKKVKYVEAYEVAEFGNQPTKEEMYNLFPMLKR